MLRSQSISNLNERKSGIFQGFRSKKSVQEKKSSDNLRKHRPLSQSISSLNLSQRYNDSIDSKKTSYTSTVARQRGGSENKENLNQLSKVNHYSLQPIKSSSSTTRISTTTATNNNNHSSNHHHHHKLKTRSSEPHLKRHSMLPMSALHFNLTNLSQSANSTPPIDILPDEISDKASIYDSDSIDSPPTYSPYTPDTENIYDPLLDLASIYIDNDFEFGYEEEVEDKFLNYQKQTIGRTNNLNNIGEFVKLIDEHHESLLNRLPINNRKSLDMEQLEHNQIRESLQLNLNKEANEDNYITKLKLVENAVFVGFEIPHITSIGNYELEDDYSGVLKNESYDDREEDFYIRV